ncbi:penicillin-binding protein activator LpoB [Endomicrobium proavitum]|nr:penicillin-binding protein activator LpoB [Endomicrobium proavitum]
MNFKKAVAFVFAGVVALSLASCSSTKVTRVDSGEVIDLSGNWNDTDSQQVSQEMITESLTYPWYAQFAAEHKSVKPRVIIGSVLNKTEEHISTETFIKDLERNLINNGKVTFVASKDQREEIRAERADQAVNSKNAKKQQNESAADFMLKGQINSIFDSNGKDKLKYYQVELEIIDMESNETVWVGQKKIKKVISKSSYKS